MSEEIVAIEIQYNWIYEKRHKLLKTYGIVHADRTPESLKPIPPYSLSDRPRERRGRFSRRNRETQLDNNDEMVQHINAVNEETAA